MLQRINTTYYKQCKENICYRENDIKTKKQTLETAVQMSASVEEDLMSSGSNALAIPTI